MTEQVRDGVRALVELAPRGLKTMYLPDRHAFVQTIRGVAGPEGPSVVGEGENLRYGAISALGLALADVSTQSDVLAGDLVANLVDHLLEQAAEHADPGAVALTCWAAAETCGTVDPDLFARLRHWLDGTDSLPVVDLSWMLTAAVAALAVGSDVNVLRLRDDVASRLLAAQGPAGIFPHVDPVGAQSRLRRHVGCFADQVYPIQALSRFAASTGQGRARAAANRCAARICELQGPAGQWWWHYDVRDGSVVEGYPVYSVHQHAMAPMALLDLAAADGDDHLLELTTGLEWLTTHPEVFEELHRRRARRDLAQGGSPRAREGDPQGRRRNDLAASRAPSARYGSGLSHHLRGPRVPPVRARLAAVRLAPLGRRDVADAAADPRTSMTSSANRTLTDAPAADQRQLFGLVIDASTRAGAVDLCREAIRERRRLLIGVVNAAKIVNLTSDERLRDSLLDCNVVLADGQSLVWVGKLLRRPLPERVAGIDLFEALLDMAHEERYSVYLLGATADVSTRLTEVVRDRWPNAVLAGSRDGYFSDEEAPEVAADIAAVRPDMLFLGITSPKKEIFLSRFGDDLGVPVLHGVGGSFDILAGLTQRAPMSWQRAGMEWAYRLRQEPSRLWWRYLRTNTIFVGLTIREFVRPRPLFARTGSDHG